ncbi:hypothetical protein KI659_11665 [Litoribacter alkaliphilus]|uniref:Uncharacterized protein n=1 Tax=Litoribacter ruber TaxID=702568 RepID=A0AAP2CK25_9BACT|nr:hypothetical protein [Litoribacter alkaliphilus]MBS9524666.1 hypothetical protein [Litoribacter alkaliphilus]
MKNFPKNDIFKTPDGYFDRLPDEIMAKQNQKGKQVYLKALVGVAAALIIGFTVVFNLFRTEEPAFTASADMDEEIELLINSDYWQAEDILLLSDHPDDILDNLIAMEWDDYYLMDEMDEDWWY